MFKVVAVPLYLIGAFMLLEALFTFWSDPTFNPPYSTGSGLRWLEGMVKMGVAALFWTGGAKLWQR